MLCVFASQSKALLLVTPKTDQIKLIKAKECFALRIQPGLVVHGNSKCNWKKVY
jgi:hypothetical protein